VNTKGGVSGWLSTHSQMKYSVLLVVLFATVTLATDAQCHPECRWQCDDPVCPAICHPVCERPRCQMQCEETACAKCTIHCEKPICSVRCPKDMCEKDSCPQCETVCAPAQCHTKCVAPDPVCTPLCEKTACEWKCKKPSMCPKPKCELQCEKPACEVKQHCPCQCNNQANVRSAMSRASHHSHHSSMIETSMVPSFLEVMASMLHTHQQGKSTCCPCAQEDNQSDDSSFQV